jgi:hypothetical protein
MAETSTIYAAAQFARSLTSGGGGSGLFSGLNLTGFASPKMSALPPKEYQQPPVPSELGSGLDRFFEYLGPALANIPRYEPPTQQEIILKLPEETKESGQMENGPQVYQGFAGALGPLAQQAGRYLGRTIFGGGTGGVAGTVGGALTGYGVGQMMSAGDACGCGPKSFVRLDKCGRPIITRAMQAKAKDMVMCMGIEGAAQALGVSVPLLAEIAFKRFKPRAKGISGAQLKTAKRVARQMHSAQKAFKAAVAGRKC